MNAFTEIKAKGRREWQEKQRAQRARFQELTPRHQELILSDRRAETVRERSKREDAPEDHGSDGAAQADRLSTKRNLEAVSTGSATEGRRIEVKHMTCECYLDWIRVSKLLGEEPDATHRYLAGIRFRGLWLTSRGASRVTASYQEQLPGAVGMRMAEFLTETRVKVDLALEALSVPQRLIVIAVCGEDQKAGHVLDKEGEPVGKKHLLSGLDALHKLWSEKRRGGN